LEATTGVSIIVCCYNSAQRIAKTLSHIACQEVSPEIRWEVILVDNASTDDTTQVAKQEWTSYQCTAFFSIVYEALPGLVNAKERGFLTAQYEFLLFVDDDNWLDENYVQLAYEIMFANPTIGILGGQSEGVFEVSPPIWFEGFQAVYAVGPQGEKRGPLPRNEGYIYGAGCLIRKSSWEYIREKGFVALSSGRKGNVLSAGEDVELGNALRLAGYELWYDDRLKFKHYLPKERLNWTYLLRVAKGGVNLSDIIYYFIFRYSQLSDRKFMYLYCKRIIWLILQIARYSINQVFKRKKNSLEKKVNMFLIERTSASLIFSIRKLSIVLSAFQTVKAFKKEVESE